MGIPQPSMCKLHMIIIVYLSCFQQDCLLGAVFSRIVSLGAVFSKMSPFVQTILIFNRIVSIVASYSYFQQDCLPWAKRFVPGLSPLMQSFVSAELSPLVGCFYFSRIVFLGASFMFQQDFSLDPQVFSSTRIVSLGPQAVCFIRVVSL